MSTGNQSGAKQQGTEHATMSQEKHADASESESKGMSGVVRDAQDTLVETAHQTLDSAKQTAQDITAQTQEQVGDVVSKTVDQASQAISDVKEQAASAYTTQRDRAVEMLTELAEALKKTGQNLTSDALNTAQDHNGAMALGPFIEEAADRITQSADFLRDKDMSSLMREAQTLARKQPLLFLGAMFGIGVAGARMFKGMSDGGASSAKPSGSSQTAPASLAEVGKSGTTGQMSQRADQEAVKNDREPFATPASEDVTNRPDAFLGLDESAAGAGAAASRPEEAKS